MSVYMYVYIYIFRVIKNLRRNAVSEKMFQTTRPRSGDLTDRVRKVVLIGNPDMARSSVESPRPGAGSVLRSSSHEWLRMDQRIASFG